MSKKIPALFLVFVMSLSPAFSGVDAMNSRTRSEAVPSDDSLTLAFPGISGPVRYEKFGSFENEGTPHYRFVIKDKKGLADAVGEGIFPNTAVTRDPAYQALMEKKELSRSHWQYVDSNTSAKNFYKWASTSEEPGVKQFFTAVMLERCGAIEQAVKAYYATAVHFPKSVSWTYYDTPWYVGPAALDRVTALLRSHPNLKMELRGAKIDVKNRFDTDLKNDEFFISPGRLIASKSKKRGVDVSKQAVIKKVGGPTFKLVQYRNRHWQFFVDNKPFPIKAITYMLTPVGKSPDRGTWNVSKDWQLADTNNNGQHDGFDESFVDANRNNIQDDNEPTVGDGRLLKEMGVNTLRAYHHLYNKQLFRRLHEQYGFYVMCGDLIGMYAVGSGASWAEGTDYSNPQHQKNMLDSIRTMVAEYKDEPYVLMWVLGNENIYGVANNSTKDPVSFYRFVNKAATLIHELDPSRPVAISNGDLFHLESLARYAPAVDIVGANVYRGELGFGQHFFMNVKDLTDRPVMVTEYGASAYAEGYSQEQAEAYQAMYLANQWDDLYANRAGHGEGNSLGGVLFEYVDEWWKANSDLPEKVQKAKAAWYAAKSAHYKNLQPDNQDNVPQFGLPFLDGWSYEEYLGVVSLGNGQNSPFVRQLRPAYFRMKKEWTGREK